jgi:hypothetical protein
VKKSCYNCGWLSDKYVSVCCNDESEHCGDFVLSDDVCGHWKHGKPPESPEEWEKPMATGRRFKKDGGKEKLGGRGKDGGRV